MNDEHKAFKKKSKETMTARRIVWITVLIFVILVGIIIIGGYFYIQHALQPVNPDSHKKEAVHVEKGATVSNIAHKLDEKGIIHNAMIFQYYIKYKDAHGFQAGYYKFSPAMEIDEIIARMQKGDVSRALQLQFPEGIRMTDIVDIIAKKTNHKKKAVLKKMKNRTYIKNTYMKNYNFLDKVILDNHIRYPLEGYLFPATYSFTKKNPSLETIFNKMLDKTGSILKQFKKKMKENGQRPHEVMTLASLIEEEGTKKKTRKKISSVFYNRLDKNMPLQTDPTVNYAQKERGADITTKDLNTDSPYNTYEHKGLPPGPIAIPSKNAIASAIEPKKTDYLYFYAKVDGEVLFSKNYKAHQKKVKKYNDDWKEYIRKEKNENK